MVTLGPAAENRESTVEGDSVTVLSAASVLSLVAVRVTVPDVEPAATVTVVAERV